MYFVVIIKSDSQAINRYETENAARAAFHHEMDYAYSADVSTLCLIVDETGTVKKRDSYIKPEPIPEPEDPVEETPEAN